MKSILILSLLFVCVFSAEEAKPDQKAPLTSLPSSNVSQERTNSSLMSMTSLRSSKAETTQSSSPLHSKSTLMSLLLSRNAFLRPLSFKEFSTLVRIESTDNALENVKQPKMLRPAKKNARKSTTLQFHAKKNVVLFLNYSKNAKSARKNKPLNLTKQHILYILCFIIRKN